MSRSAAAVAGLPDIEPEEDAGQPRFRKRTLAQTLAAASELAPLAGVSRVADITGLDHLGLPVFSVIRPNAKSLSVASGKGLTKAAARVSGLMEAIELFHAEEFEATRPYAGIGKDVLVPDPDKLPVARGRSPSAYAPHQKMALGVEIIAQDPAAVPFGLVHANLSPGWAEAGDGYLVSSNGLASGNDREEATLHGLCEVIERDALALLEARDPAHSLRKERRVDWEDITDALTRSLCLQVYEAGVDIHLFEITTDIGVPTYYCRMADRPEFTCDVIPCDGSGCHPDKHLAMQRAVLEAAQTRLTIISGAREDIDYRCYGSPSVAPPIIATAAACEYPTFDLPDCSTALTAATQTLVAAGFCQIIVIDLGCASGRLDILRVIVPGLEGSPHSRFYSPGHRARRQR